MTIALFLAFAWYASEAFAQDVERAKQLFDEASALREAGQYQDAVIRLRQAIEIKDTPGLEYHVGFCEAKQGHYRKAIEHYERAATLLRAGASAPDVVALLARAHSSALEHVAFLSVSSALSVTGMTVGVDDLPSEALTSRDIMLDAGKHHVRVAAPGYVQEDRDITVGEADHVRVEVNLVLTSNEHGRSTSAPRSASAWKTASIGASLGIAALGLTTGVIAALGRHNAHVRVQAAQAEPNPDAALASAQHDQDSYTRWETVGFVSAGIGAVSSVALWTLWPATRGVSIVTTSEMSGAGFLVNSTF